jgi:hypothetical protein
LLFAGVFYLMMRFGCGAHMMHGHHGSSKDDPEKYTDPVCGKDVPPSEGYGKLLYTRGGINAFTCVGRGTWYLPLFD